jgi:hypothetical protein
MRKQGMTQGSLYVRVFIPQRRLVGVYRYHAAKSAGIFPENDSNPSADAGG